MSPKAETENKTEKYQKKKKFKIWVGSTRDCLVEGVSDPQAQR